VSSQAVFVYSRIKPVIVSVIGLKVYVQLRPVAVSHTRRRTRTDAWPRNATNTR